MPLLPPPEATVSSFNPEAAIVREISAVRRQHGLPGVSLSRRLAASARRQSIRVLRADLLTHSPSLIGRMTGLRARRFGETLAFTPQGTGSDARTVVQLWLHSPPHRAVMLDVRMRRVGVGRMFGILGSQRGFAVAADFSS
jgi:uncharacterized protein YkwD